MTTPAAGGPRRPVWRERLRRLGLLEPARHLKAQADGLRWAPRNLRDRWSFRDDRWPLPPASLIRLATGSSSVAWYVEGGRRAALSLRAAWARQACPLGPGRRLLDFGCGCGRVIRHWAETGATLHGCDVNPRLVAWCRRQLPFARFAVNGLTPPLDYPDASFDIVYALSVFTHLPESHQRRWMEELARILKPSGLLLISTHGDAYLPALTPAERERFRTGRLVVKSEDTPGSNRYGAYAPEAFVRDTLARTLALMEHQPGGASGNPHQDLVVLRKPGAP